MRKYILLILSALLIFSLFACGGENEEAMTEQTTSPAITAPQKKTLMVYMVGSDLESKGGAGTEDLEEMILSGVDLSSTNLLVYAGGTPYWHNEVASPSAHSVMLLTQNGFEVVSSVTNESMGTSMPLTFFLNYCYSTYPADEYALILWNHGSGPVIGYGMDLLFEKDSLTLEEMKSAFELSPFVGNQKLSFVGFDACLMASAELSYLLCDHAHYLIASQEVEPAFGWNYSFLGSFGKVSTTSLADSITSSYLSSCEEYYEKKGYSGKDTTLSCVDLSYAKELSDAINSLFRVASSHLETSYNEIALIRTDTRALGRASTGSEYDLVDLADMARGLFSLFPNESQTLLNVIDKMVVYNCTNTEGCCGMSLFYPFFNKYYYENSWDGIYTSLGVFPDYQHFLSIYRTKWLSTDKVDSLGTLATVREVAPKTYTLELSDEQAQNAAYARYYVLEQMSEDKYRMVYVSGDISKNENILTANFNGNIIYAKNNFEEYAIPFTLENDTVGDTTRYTARVMLENISGMKLEYEFYSVLLNINKKDGKISLGGWTPQNEEEEDKAPLTRGKAEDVNLSEWEYFSFPFSSSSHITRYENGIIRPLSEWVSDGSLLYNQWAVSDGLEFVYAPIDNGRYALIFEITDTQGNTYCSEPLPIEVSGVERTTYSPTPIEAAYSEGSAPFFDSDELSLAFTTQKDGDSTYFAIEFTNKTSNEISLSLSDILLSNGHYLGAYSFYLDSSESGIISLKGVTEDAAKYGSLENLSSLSFIMELSYSDDALNSTIEKNQRVNIAFSGGCPILASDVTLKGSTVKDNLFLLNAKNQTIYDDGKTRVTLLSLGSPSDGYYSTDVVATLMLENMSDQKITVDASAVAINDITISGLYASSSVLPNSFTYDELVISAKELAEKDIFFAEDFKIALSVSSYGEVGFAKTVWCPIELNEVQSTTTEEASSNLGEPLVEQNGVRIYLLSVGQNYYGNPLWKLAIYNDTDENISIDAKELSLFCPLIGPKQMGYFDLECYSYSYNGEKSVKDYFIARNPLTYETIFTTDEVTLFVEE